MEGRVMSNVDYVLLAICFAVFGITVLLATKNLLTYQATQKAIDEIFSRPNWRELTAELLDRRSYDSLLLDPRKWTYRQMFPELHDD